MLLLGWLKRLIQKIWSSFVLHFEGIRSSPLFINNSRHSNADIVLFVSTPVPDISKKILQKYQVIVMPFAISDLPTTMATFHPSTYRWYLIHQFFQVMILLSEVYSILETGKSAKIQTSLDDRCSR